MFYLVYFTPFLPHHWVAWASDGQFNRFPSNYGGWRERELYRPRERLTPALPETAKLVAECSGQGTDKVRITALDAGREYPIPEAAAAVGINAASLRTACSEGKVPGAMNMGRRWLLSAGLCTATSRDIGPGGTTTKASHLYALEASG